MVCTAALEWLAVSEEGEGSIEFTADKSRATLTSPSSVLRGGSDTSSVRLTQLPAGESHMRENTCEHLSSLGYVVCAVLPEQTRARNDGHNLLTCVSLPHCLLPLLGMVCSSKCGCREYCVAVCCVCWRCWQDSLDGRQCCTQLGLAGLMQGCLHNTILLKFIVGQYAA